MSVPSDSATSPSPCACTNISLMQLFHELKQKFPGVPDHVVSNTIELYCHDKHACETHLHKEAKASLTHAYHASSSAAARQLNELRVDAPLRCRNQPIVKHEVCNATPITAITCESPKTAILTLNNSESAAKLNTDDNQNIVDSKNHEIEKSEPIKIQQPAAIKLQHVSKDEAVSPTINIDDCVEKYSTSPKNIPTSTPLTTQPEESTLYRLHKSNKVKQNLHERLEREKSKAKKEEQERPVRPNTLEFIKPIPDIAFKENLEPESVSPPKQDTTPSWPGYPLNLSVNVNCHMDLGYNDPYLELFDNPRAITSLNLTVCTPTSSMASPVKDSKDDSGGFEGHVTVTVSPSTTRPRRRAPPPPQPPLEPQRATRSMGTTADRSLIERQRERLGRLSEALAEERARLKRLVRETSVLQAPTPPVPITRRLRADVLRLRDECDDLHRRLEIRAARPSETTEHDSDNFYSNIYTGQRPLHPLRPAPALPEETPSWQCEVCTFRNHGLLDKCEACDMARIVVGRSPTNDSGFGSLRLRNDQRRPSATSILGVDERHTNRACV